MSERNERGQFVEGNKASPGRKPRPVEANFLNVLKDGITEDDWRKVCQSALSRAMAGDFRAREWLGNYIMGKPPQILELRAAEAQMLAQLLKQLETTGTTPSELFEELLNEYAQADIEATDNGQ